MSFSEIFKKGFLSSYANTEVTFSYAVIAMAVSLVIAAVICGIYYFKSRKYFFSREFAISLVALSVITTAVILTIQSSIVVSLGMVGALSIVRFRTAVKNPLDLVFLFWSISVGIITGAGLYFIAIALTLILGIVVLLSDEIPAFGRNKLLVLDGNYPYNNSALEALVKNHSRWWSLRTETVHNDRVNLIIEVKGMKDQQELIKELMRSKDFDNISVLIQEGAVD